MSHHGKTRVFHNHSHVENGNGFAHSENNHAHAKMIDIQKDKNEYLSFIPSFIMLPILVTGIFISYMIYGFLQEEIIAVHHVNASIPLIFQFFLAMVLSLIISFCMSLSKSDKSKSSWDIFGVHELY